MNELSELHKALPYARLVSIIREFVEAGGNISCFGLVADDDALPGDLVEVDFLVTVPVISPCNILDLLDDENNAY